MASLLTNKPAPGGPGAAPMWARADKEAVGTARSSASQVWFTVAGGIVTEVYFPDVDTPQIRDLQMMFTGIDKNGARFFHDAQRDFDHTCAPIDPERDDKHEYGPIGQYAPAYRITSTAKEQPYKVVQDVITSVDSNCLLIHVRLHAEDQDLLNNLTVYALLAPHLQGQGGANSGYVAVTTDGMKLVARRANCWLALNASCGLKEASCGFVGVNDGWTDIIGNKRLPQWDYNCALNGNVALTAQIDRQGQNEFVLALGFCLNNETVGSQPNPAMVAVREAISYPFDQKTPPGQLQAYIADWVAGMSSSLFQPVDGITGDKNYLFNLSHNILLCHEDKESLGALVASLSIPWGYNGGDSDAGYHLVWPRDMCQSATALLAAGERDLPLRGLMFLATSQSPDDGGFHQNFYLNGVPYWDGVQLDEISYPIILAYRLAKENALQNYNPKHMVLAAAGALIAKGPMTQEERWEENEGYSPSTLASNIAGLVCAADLAEHEWNDPVTAQFLREHADFLESHLETWCVTTRGSLDQEPYYIRILPTQVKSVGNNRNPSLPEDPNTANIYLKNIAGGGAYPARDIVDGGFLELVRLGVRPADDPIIRNTVKVIDAVLKDDLPSGPCYRRYNHDGYGQGDQGQPFGSQGVGRPWPLLTGERGHYELAAKGQEKAKPYVGYMENFAGDRGLFAEQLWNGDDVPEAIPPLKKGSPTGSAMPLAWAHAEYIKLVRSISDGKVFDRLDVVVDRYKQRSAPMLEVWNFDRQFRSVPAGRTVRIPLNQPFRLRWTHDGWNTWQDTDASSTAVGIYYVDLPTQALQVGSTLEFTFFWLLSQTWEGQSNFYIRIHT